MLYEFIRSHRAVLVERCGVLFDFQSDNSPTQAQSTGQIEVFLDQVVAKLKAEDALEKTGSSSVAAATVSPATEHTGRMEKEIAASASIHGGQLHALGFSIDAVIRNYGSVCQAVTSLAA